MNFTYIFMILFYWVFLSGAVFLAGAFISRIFITGPSGADVCEIGGARRYLGESAARHIFRIAIIVFVVNAIHLTLHASIMTETPLNEVFSILTIFLTKTKYGRLTLIRTLIIAAIVVFSLLALRRDRRWATISGNVSALSLLVVISMSGHQGTKGYATLPFFLDILHIVAVSLWIGGLFYIRFCYAFFLKEAGEEFHDIFRKLLNRFSFSATYCVFIAGITGVVLAFFNIQSLSNLVHTQYGIVFMGKVFIAGFIFFLGGINKFFIIPLLNVADTKEWSKVKTLRKRLFYLVTAEVYLGMTVLFATSLLTHLSPMAMD
jgi:putative copper resistance protein D